CCEERKNAEQKDTDDDDRFPSEPIRHGPEDKGPDHHSEQPAGQQRPKGRPCQMQLCRQRGCNEAHRLGVEAVREHQSGTHCRREQLISAERLLIDEPPNFEYSGSSHQNTYFTANWRIRGSSDELIWPKMPLLKFVTGFPRRRLFVTL